MNVIRARASLMDRKRASGREARKRKSEIEMKTTTTMTTTMMTAIARDPQGLMSRHQRAKTGNEMNWKKDNMYYNPVSLDCLRTSPSLSLSSFFFLVRLQ